MPYFPSRYWKKINEKIIQCEVCPNFCKLKEGKRGRCFVRGNLDGKMAVYCDSKNSGVAVDPIEKKPLNHFLPGTRILSFGTVGCNLSCKFCQNWHISHTKDSSRLNTEVSAKQLVSAAVANQCDSIAFTYNDPIIFLELARDVAIEARKHGIKTVAVTAGYMCPEPAEEFCQFIDAFNVDLKAFSKLFYSQICNAKLEPVLETLQTIVRSGKWLEITNLLIPTKNDSLKEIHDMCHWIVDKLGPNVPVHFTAFHPDGEMLDLPRTSPDMLFKARDIANSVGIKYVYTGNIDHPPTQSTFCSNSKCGSPLVYRNRFGTQRYPSLGVDQNGAGFCRKCGTSIEGSFMQSQYGDVSIDRPYRVHI
eukprot:TRINITY_DN37354_c0_g1_i1.p1 TRINITY_DN37354_c0_g1~~TRINITY_DN37354_c0_g1_i1.p1  ORF type:complete len:363 (+),score=41.90 TRINITY_DN37354_c0_g1_i1:62-1150(+)